MTAYRITTNCRMYVVVAESMENALQLCSSRKIDKVCKIEIISTDVIMDLQSDFKSKLKSKLISSINEC